MRNTLRSRKATQGFTLIELLIVIAIIGILAAVLIPNLLNARKRAFDTAAQSCAQGLATASEVTMVDNQKYVTVAAADYPPACKGVTVTGAAEATGVSYSYTTKHPSGNASFTVAPNTGVVRVAPAA